MTRRQIPSNLLPWYGAKSPALRQAAAVGADGAQIIRTLQHSQKPAQSAGLASPMNIVDQ